eukprot:1848763-Pleurochrysis_carterae.AAC.1
MFETALHTLPNSNSDGRKHCTKNACSELRRVMCLRSFAQTAAAPTHSFVRAFQSQVSSNFDVTKPQHNRAQHLALSHLFSQNARLERRRDVLDSKSHNLLYSVNNAAARSPDRQNVTTTETSPVRSIVSQQ